MEEWRGRSFGWRNRKHGVLKLYYCWEQNGRNVILQDKLHKRASNRKKYHNHRCVIKKPTKLGVIIGRIKGCNFVKNRRANFGQHKILQFPCWNDCMASVFKMQLNKALYKHRCPIFCIKYFIHGHQWPLLLDDGRCKARRVLWRGWLINKDSFWWQSKRISDHDVWMASFAPRCGMPECYQWDFVGLSRSL